LFMTPTIMGAADLVLPVASLLEHDGYVSNSNASQPGQFGSITKVIEPLGECKSDLEIMLELHHRLYPNSTNEKFASIDNYINSEIAGIPGIGDTTYADMQKNVIGQYELEYKKYEKGMLRSDGQPGFNTSTGRIELWSTMLNKLGDDPMPYYSEPKFSALSRPDLVDDYPLILTTGARRFTSFHSENRQIERLREIHRYPTVEINPQTAQALGITEGSWVYIENLFGRVKMVAHLTPIVQEGVVSADHGWWLPEAGPDDLYEVFDHNVGTLIPHEVNGPLGFGTHYNSRFRHINLPYDKPYFVAYLCRMLLLYIIFAAYIIAVNVYSIMLLLSLRNDYLTDESKLNAGDGKLILSALLGGAIGIYVTMFITRFKLKNMVLMILLPVIGVLNVWFCVVAFRSGFTFIAA